MSSQSYTFPKKTIKDIEVSKKRTLLRADFNVPFNEDGTIASDYRISQTIPTIKFLLERGAEVVIISHLGRPEGKANKSFSLRPVQKVLEELLGSPVAFIPNCIHDSVKQTLKTKQPGNIWLLENVRFHPGEEANDPEFAKQLIQAIQPDFVVQDGFGVVHRAHASTEGISHLVPAVAGLLLEKEVTTLESAMLSPQKPLVTVLGGAKISDKLPLVERFLKKADRVLVGGAMANNFLKEQGTVIGKSKLDEDGSSQVKEIIKTARPQQLILPTDVATGTSLELNEPRHDKSLTSIQADDIILDIGFETMRLFTEHIKSAGTIIWNGTLGMAENPQFAQGSSVIAEAISQLYPDVTSIIGGGDTADFVLEWQTKHPKSHFSHISTGGGASLELMSGKKLPGVEALIDK